MFAEMRLKILAGVGVLVLAAVLGFIGWHVYESYSASQERARRLASTNVAVQVAEVGRRDIAAKFMLAGKLEPAWTVDVSPLIEGRIIRLLVSEGELIKDGKVIAVLDTRELAAQVAQAEANALAARGSLAQAESDLNRSQALIKYNAVSVQTLENDRSKRDIARAQVQAAEANVTSARARMAHGDVRAHRGGTVTKVYLNEGGYARSGAAIINLSATDELVAKVVVSELLARQLTVGMQIPMRVDQYGGRPVMGKVLRVVAPPDFADASSMAVISFANPQGDLKAGMTVSGELAGQLVRNAVAVPAQAIIAREGRQVVFVIMKDGVSDQRTIRTGVSDGEWVEMLEGIDASSERVVITGLDRMQDGIRVNVK